MNHKGITLPISKHSNVHQHSCDYKSTSPNATPPEMNKALVRPYFLGKRGIGQGAPFRNSNENTPRVQVLASWKLAYPLNKWWLEDDSFPFEMILSWWHLFIFVGAGSYIYHHQSTSLVSNPSSCIAKALAHTFDRIHSVPCCRIKD